MRHGYERWWYGDNKTIWSEQHFQDGQSHGIYREWNGLSLRRGFPRYYANGQKVNKRQYLKACEQDPSLPEFSEADNRPCRALPHELMAQAARFCPELLKETDGSASVEEQELIRNSQGRGKE